MSNAHGAQIAHNAMLATTAHHVAAMIDAARELEAREAAEYSNIVKSFNATHPPKVLCLKCLGIVGESCDCEMNELNRQTAVSDVIIK